MTRITRRLSPGPPQLLVGGGEVQIVSEELIVLIGQRVEDVAGVICPGGLREVVPSLLICRSLAAWEVVGAARKRLPGRVMAGGQGERQHLGDGPSVRALRAPGRLDLSTSGKRPRIGHADLTGRYLLHL